MDQAHGVSLAWSWHGEPLNVIIGGKNPNQLLSRGLARQGISDPVLMYSFETFGPVLHHTDGPTSLPSAPLVCDILKKAVESEYLPSVISPSIIPHTVFIAIFNVAHTSRDLASHI